MLTLNWATLVFDHPFYSHSCTVLIEIPNKLFSILKMVKKITQLPSMSNIVLRCMLHAAARQSICLYIYNFCLLFLQSVPHMIFVLCYSNPQHFWFGTASSTNRYNKSCALHRTEWSMCKNMCLVECVCSNSDIPFIWRLSCCFGSYDKSSSWVFMRIRWKTHLYWAATTCSPLLLRSPYKGNINVHSSCVCNSTLSCWIHCMKLSSNWAVRRTVSLLKTFNIVFFSCSLYIHILHNLLILKHSFSRTWYKSVSHLVQLREKINLTIFTMKRECMAIWTFDAFWIAWDYFINNESLLLFLTNLILRVLFQTNLKSPSLLASAYGCFYMFFI